MAYTSDDSVCKKEYLMCKYEGLSLNPQHPYKNLGVFTKRGVIVSVPKLSGLDTYPRYIHNTYMCVYTYIHICMYLMWSN